MAAVGRAVETVALCEGRGRKCAQAVVGQGVEVTLARPASPGSILPKAYGENEASPSGL